MLHGQRSKVMWCGLIRNTMQTVIASFSKCISVRNLWFLLPGFTIKNNPNPNPVIEMLYIIWFHFVYCRLRISLHNHNVPRDSSVLSFVQVLFSQFCSVLSSVLSSILFLLRTVVYGSREGQFRSIPQPATRIPHPASLLTFIAFITFIAPAQNSSSHR